jgi:hypothetical protein
MAIGVREWLDVIDREYLRSFIVEGGSAIKFLVADEAGLNALQEELKAKALEHGLVFAAVDSANVKLHMMQDLFFAISRQIDWEADAQFFIESLFQRYAYKWPAAGRPAAMSEIGEANGIDVTILRREVNRWLTSDVMKDPALSQDFRIAVMQLCRSRMSPADGEGEVIAPVLQWLRGERIMLSALKSATIYTRITRHNARAMLRSLCRWLCMAGHKGLLVTVDIRQLTRTKTAVTEGVTYTSGAVMDAYEVLRQVVDEVDLFTGLFTAVLADDLFIGDDRKRSISAYTALKMRIWDDVRALTHDNPLAPMAVIRSNP